MEPPLRQSPSLLLTLVLLAACSNPEVDLSASPSSPSTLTAPDPATLPDGWARGSGSPVSPGGAAAPSTRIYTVTNRTQLINALKTDGTSYSDQAKILYVEGMIDLCSDGDGKHLEPEDFLAQAGLSSSYPTYQAYRDAYAASCATGVASTLAATRTNLANRQKAVMVIPVGSNTTLLGRGTGAGFKNGSLSISGKTNVVIRNLAILDSYDYFPAWDQGENLINSNYDTVAITNSTYVWIDHCRVGDGDRPDSGLFHITVSGLDKKWVVHDGLIDVTNGSNYVTLSWNRVENHDKTMLFGGSDSASGDTGKLKVTVHHNWFSGTTQRLPRVRFGQVHVYNNYYERIGDYAIGVGDQARIYSEANDFSGTTRAFGKSDHSAAEGYLFDLGSVKNVADNSTELPSTALLVGWNPADSYSYTADAASEVKAKVTAGAGPGAF